jgi:hypothetical protein
MLKPLELFLELVYSQKTIIERELIHLLALRKDFENLNPDPR